MKERQSRLLIAAILERHLLLPDKTRPVWRQASSLISSDTSLQGLRRCESIRDEPPATKCQAAKQPEKQGDARHDDFIGF